MNDATETAADLLYREALALDERRWDDWLALYDEAAEFWVPAWKSEDQPTDDPSSEVSLVYAARRSELEDRVWRVRSGQSIASSPLPRTAHIVTNVLGRGRRRRRDRRQLDLDHPCLQCEAARASICSSPAASTG